MSVTYDVLKDNNLWVWWAETEINSVPAFLYGAVAPTDKLVAALSTIVLPLPSGKTLSWREGVLEPDAAGPFLAALSAEEIDPSTLGGTLPPIPILSRRRTLVPAFGRSTVAILGAAGQPIALRWLTSPDGLAALEAMQSDLGLPFTNSFAGRLGGLDVFDLPPPDRPEPLSLALRRAGAAGDRLEIRRARDLLDADLVARLALTSSDELVTEILVKLPRAIEVVGWDIPAHVDALELSVFPGTGGERVYAESNVYLSQVNISGSLMSDRDVQIDDKLAKRTQSRPDLRSQVSSPFPTPAWQDVVLDPGNRAGLRAREARHRVTQALAWTADRWFDRSLDSEVGVLVHIDRLLKGEGVVSAVLVDPFFGKDALARLLVRLGASDIALTIVTSWAETDADSAARTTPDANVRLLGAELERFRGLISPKVRLRNLVRGEGRQAFHDRYLLLNKEEGETIVYLLSNSVNAMAAEWPFVMSVLTGKAAHQATQYVEALASDDPVSLIPPFVENFAWPQP